jgi:hypothetical protein
MGWVIKVPEEEKRVNKEEESFNIVPEVDKKSSKKKKVSSGTMSEV